VDDSPEKCIENPVFSCIHPLPYDDPEVDDVELVPAGKLWKYLIELAGSGQSIEEFVQSHGAYQPTTPATSSSPS
jgi:hypothetical protein